MVKPAKKKIAMPLFSSLSYGDIFSAMFMVVSNVLIHVARLRKSFSTILTYLIFDLVMNILDVSSQMTRFVEGFVALLAFVTPHC